MRIVPVLDVMGGKVVRGIGGRRDEYRPIVSRLTSSVDPLVIAEVFREHFDLSELYLADLDAIRGAAPLLNLYRELIRRSFTLWVDAGLHDLEGMKPLLELGVHHPVAGLETVSGPAILSELCAACEGRLVFSLDLKAGQPLTQSSDWPSDSWSIAETAISVGGARLLVLDLANIGTGSGAGSESLCLRLSSTYPHVEFSTGGGVRGIEDLRHLRASGVKAVLVASALHDGRLTAESLSEFR